MTLTRLTALGLLFVLLTGAVLLLVPDHAFAQSATSSISQGLDAAAGTSYSTELTVSVFIGNMIRTLLAATGIVFLILTVYAGILYMTDQGDAGKIKKAKSILTSSVIGLIIIVGAYAITSYVVEALAQAATTTTTTEP
ncbi:hypothetical protein HY626_03645 [Candidatus Uhrbacteria bacterium]|nr:hypothetical protein [Candidatus Uhrbacteria bacterium]